MSDSQVFRPQDVLEGGLRDQLHEAVISAYMATGVLGEADGHSINRHLRTLWEGGSIRYEYEASIVGESYPVYCTYPSGDWQLDVSLFPDLGDYPGFTAINVTGRWEELKAEVDSWLDPWVTTCPDPSTFENQITSMARIASQLDIGGVSTGGGQAGGDTDLREAVKTISNRAFGKANSLVAFRDVYASDLWTTINNQCGMTMSAGLALTAEGSAWSETYRNLHGLLQVAIEAFNQVAKGDGGGDHSAALGATSAVIGLLGATAGVAFPPFGVAMGGLSAVIGVYTVMNPARPAVPRDVAQLSGDTYESMWSSFVEAMRTVSADLASAEQSVADGCRQVVLDVRSNPESYSLSQNTSTGRQYDDFDKALVTEIDLPKNLLQEMAGAAELVGDQQLKLAGFVAGADAQGNPSALVRDEWSRGVLPDGTSIGLDSGYGDGPFGALRELVDAATDLLHAEGKNSHRMAETLMRTALDFALTDELSDDESRRVQRQIDNRAAPLDHNPLYAGNDPTDPWFQKIDR